MNIRTLIFTSSIGLPLLLSAGIAPAPALELTGSDDYRAVLGETVVTDFGVQNTAGVQTDFDLYYTNDEPVISNTYETPGTATGGLTSISQPDGVGSIINTGPTAPWLNNSLNASVSGTLQVFTNLSDSVAGDVVTVGVSAVALGATPNVDATVSDFTEINVVTNRLLTGSTGGATIDNGRHMVNQKIATITLDGGTLDHNQATDITVNSGGVANLSDGLRLTSNSGSDVVFDGAIDNQTSDLNVYRNQTGSYDISRGLTAGEGSSGFSPLMTAEAIQGSEVDLSGVSVDVEGTALSDRQLTSNTIDLGRYMLGTAAPTVDQSDSITINTSGDDNNRTRLNLGDVAVDSGGASPELSAARTGAQLFDDGSDSATVQVTADFERTTDVQGYNSKTIDIGGSITNGEESLLDGQTVQTELNVGYSWNNLADNKVVATDLLVIEGENRDGSRAYLTGVSYLHSTTTHTAIVIDSASSQISTSTDLSAGLHTIATEQKVEVSEELGVVGVQDLSDSHDFFTGKIASVSAATATVTDESLLLTDGSAITITDTGSGLYQNDVYLQSASATNNYDLTNTDSDSLEHGSRVIGVDYLGEEGPSVGGLSRIAKGTAEIQLRDVANTTEILAAAGLDSNVSVSTNYDNNSTTLSYKLETRFEAPEATSGYAEVNGGDDFGLNGLALKNTGANTDARFTDYATKAELLDSDTLVGGTVTLSFSKLGDVATAEAARIDALQDHESNAGSVVGMYQGDADKSLFVSDIVSLTGLSNQLHVLEVDFDGSFEALDALGNESAAQLVWNTTFDHDGDNGVTTPEQEAWINAVLGNSNIDELNLVGGTLTVLSGLGFELGATTIDDYLALTRFAGSYEEYLEGSTNPQLGAWGVDTSNGQVWAVIDHNSDFAAAVPEPTTYALIAGVFALAATMSRRRK